MNAFRRAALALLATGLLVAVPVNAVYVETPLRLEASDPNPDVGDRVDLAISPGNESSAGDFAGADVRVRYSTEDGREGSIGALRLDEGASGSLSWTVPDEVRDANLFLVVLSAGGETLATLHLAIGNAVPVMYAAGGVADGAEDGPNPQPEVERGSPGAGTLAAVAALGALALGRRTA